MNRTIKDATVKIFHYGDLQSLEAHVLAFVTAYNFARHLKALRWKTPFQTICQAWTKDPDRFKIDPHHLIPGPYTAEQDHEVAMGGVGGPQLGAVDPPVVALPHRPGGREALAYWREIVPVAHQNGSLLVAPARDVAELARFGRRTSHFETLGGAEIAALEPDLGGRFSRALYFAGEAHLDPRAALAELRRRLDDSPLATFRFESAADTPDSDWIIDCRGYAARDSLPDLRGVKGEMLVLHTHDIMLSRPVQLIHPRNPVYIVPRGDGRFMVGATMIENEERSRVRARALVDLIGAAYTVHPAFGEAEVVEIGCDLRPAFPNNLPRIRRDGRRLFINGLFRHGFLLAPALAARACRMALEGAHFPEVSDADPRQRKTA